jgi:hypothetical protein
MNKTLVTPHYTLAIEEGILIVTYFRGLKIDPVMANDIIRVRSDFTESRTYPLLIIDEGVLSVDKGARDLFSGNEGTARISASAMIFESTYGKIAGSFFLRVIRPDIPVRVFTQKEKALAWLEKFKKKESEQRK